MTHRLNHREGCDIATKHLLGLVNVCQPPILQFIAPLLLFSAAAHLVPVPAAKVLLHYASHSRDRLYTFLCCHSISFVFVSLLSPLFIFPYIFLVPRSGYFVFFTFFLVLLYSFFSFSPPIQQKPRTSRSSCALFVVFLRLGPYRVV